eukprot:scaffold13143_cov27-Cyclotella_meneghiniana.AAC.1
MIISLTWLDRARHLLSYPINSLEEVCTIVHPSGWATPLQQCCHWPRVGSALASQFQPEYCYPALGLTACSTLAHTNFGCTILTHFFCFLWFRGGHHQRLAKRTCHNSDCIRPGRIEQGTGPHASESPSLRLS